jgi:hypothetical protein
MADKSQAPAQRLQTQADSVFNNKSCFCVAMVFHLLKCSADNTGERLMNMSIAPILNSITNQNVTNFQAQQPKVQQPFQSLAQEFQSGDLSAAQSTVSEETLRTTAQSSSSQPDVQNDGMDSNLRKHIRIDWGSEGTSSQAVHDLGQQAGLSAAVQAYNGLGQNLQQAELGNDLTGAQISGEISSLSLTV